MIVFSQRLNSMILEVFFNLYESMTQLLHATFLLGHAQQISTGHPSGDFLF